MSIWVLYIVLLTNGIPHRTAFAISPSRAQCQAFQTVQEKLNTVPGAIWVCNEEFIK